MSIAPEARNTPIAAKSPSTGGMILTKDFSPDAAPSTNAPYTSVFLQKPYATINTTIHGMA